MNPELNAEIDCLKKILASVDLDFPEMPGAKDREIRRIRRKTGIKLFGDIVEFYKFRNGSDHELVFAVITDEMVPCEFLSLDRALNSWSYSESNPDQYYERVNRQYQDYQQSPSRDERIQQNIWANNSWFPFGEFNGGATKIYLDLDPTPIGKVGQIIAYQHDPDAVYYIGSDFLSFLKKSNNLLNEYAQELFF